MSKEFPGFIDGSVYPSALNIPTDADFKSCLQTRSSATLYILKLANSFPCLQSKMRHYQPTEFDSLEFERMSRVWSTGERYCALFVCAVWNNRNLNNRWDGKPFERYVDFDVVDAMGTLSSDNRKPIIDWIANPVWV